MKMLFYLFLFWTGGIIYQIIEKLWSGHSHWSMFFAGGLSLVVIDGLYDTFYEALGLVPICVFGAIAITCIEFLCGCIVNIKLKLRVWDYGKCRGNILGQICPQFIFYWCLLTIPAVWAATFVRSCFGSI